MTITSEWDVLWADKTENYDGPVDIRSKLQDAYNNLDEAVVWLKERYDAGDFDKFPTPLSKTKAQALYNHLRTSRNTVRDDAGSMELINWTP